MSRHWLMKSEPSVFSFEDLENTLGKRAAWEGVRNYQARNYMRDDFKLGDQIVFYHSSCDIPGAIGLAEVIKEAYPDPYAFDPKSKYFDETAKKKGINPWVMIDVKAVIRFKTFVTRELMKSDHRLDKALVLQKGSRLSIQPLLEREFEAICELGKINGHLPSSAVRR